MTEARRVLMVCPQFRPLIGGYERAAERLSGALVARGHTVDVVTERRDPGWPARETVDGFRILRIRSVPRPGVHGPSTVAAFGAFVLRRARAYDVVHAHQYGWPAAAALGAARLCGVPTVLKLTNTGDDGIDAVLPAGAAGAISRGLHRRVSACIATSERARAEAVAFGLPAARIHRIPNPLDTARFAPADAARRREARERLGLGEAPLALSVGRLSAEKNHAMLIDAFAKASERVPTSRLAILGGGPLEAELRERVARSPAAARIDLVGPVEDPLPWYAAADVFALSSRHEGLSNSLMEALSCGLPCVATRVSGVEDVFAEADVGRLVEPGETAAFAEALGDALGAPDRRRPWAEAARAYASAHYAIDRVVDATLALYDGLTGGPGARRAPGAA